MADLAESLAERFSLVRPHLTELQQRLWLGAEASVLGSGGVAVVAAAVGAATDTVRRGRTEVRAADGVPAMGRSRQPGGGRKRAETHDHDLVAALESLIDPVTRGDPMSPLRWTSKSTRKLATALTEKTTEGAHHPDRDAQFQYLNDQADQPAVHHRGPLQPHRLSRSRRT